MLVERLGRIDHRGACDGTDHFEDRHDVVTWLHDGDLSGHELVDGLDDDQRDRVVVVDDVIRCGRIDNG